MSDRPLLLVLALCAALPLSASAQARPKPGRYEGTAYNTTVSAQGHAVFELTEVDPSTHEASARFTASEGLSGDGWLTGTVDASGAMSLSGTLSDWTMVVKAHPAGSDSISATYTLSGPSTQQGEFKVHLVAAAAPVLAPGAPPLTQSIVEDLSKAWGTALELTFTPAQRQRLQAALVSAWKQGDRAVIDRAVDDLHTLGGKSAEELRGSLGPDYQTALVEGMRRNEGRNPVLSSLVQAFDAAHPDRVAATRAQGFSDLVGTWKKLDAVAPNLSPVTGLPMGPAFQDGGTLTFASDGKFDLTHTHNHCDNNPGRNCCRLEGETWHGTASVKNGELVFQIASGQKLHQDSCNPGMSSQSKIGSRLERATWQIRANPSQNNKPALCWHAAGDVSGCYTRQ